MVIYQFSKTSKILNFKVTCTVQAMFGCGLGETMLRLSEEVKYNDK